MSMPLFRSAETFLTGKYVMRAEEQKKKMENPEKQKKLARALINIGVYALYAWIGWGLFAGLFLFLTGYVSKAVYLGIFAALAALCFTGVFLGRRLEKVYLENLQAMISIDDILKEEGIEADFYPEQRLETDILAHQGLFGYARADGNNLISGSYNGSPFRSSFLSFSMPGARGTSGAALYRGRVSILGMVKAFSGKTLFLCESSSAKQGMTKQGYRMLIKSAGVSKKTENDIGPLRCSRWSVYSDDEQGLKELLAKESGFIDRLNESKIDFILCSGTFIIFGAQDMLEIDRYGVSESDVQKSIRESIQRIVADISCVLLLHSLVPSVMMAPTPPFASSL